MSTFATAELDSDDENDTDFQPQAVKTHGIRKRRRDGSRSSSGSSSGEERVNVDTDEAIKLKADQEAVEAEERRRKAVEAYESMKVSAKTVTPISNGTVKAVEAVKVQRTRQFAGETIS